MTVVTRFSYGCPVQAIVHAFDLDERTVASWRDRAGKQCEQVHHAVVEQGKLDLVHVQADEIRVKEAHFYPCSLQVTSRCATRGPYRPIRRQRIRGVPTDQNGKWRCSTWIASSSTSHTVAGSGAYGPTGDSTLVDMTTISAPLGATRSSNCASMPPKAAS